MDKKVVVITGASSGLGKALANLYGKKGYTLVLSGRNEEELHKSTNDNTDFIIGDLTQKETIQKIADIVNIKHNQIDILINNAGILYIQPLEQNTEEQLDTIFEINVKSHIRLTQKLLPLMKQQQSGHIINIISTAGKEGKLNHTLYCATKYAMSGFTESLRFEAKQHNIRVSGIYPGGIKTHIFDTLPTKIDQTTFMEAEDVSKTIVDLSETKGISPDTLVITKLH